MIFLSFCLFLFLFTLIGFLSVLKKKNTAQDYLLANQEIKPWLGAISAIATSNSGYMFIGQIGFTYVYGCLLYTSPSPRDRISSRMPSSA